MSELVAKYRYVCVCGGDWSVLEVGRLHYREKK